MPSSRRRGARSGVARAEGCPPSVRRDRRVRLVSITGPGGIGKSRLVWEMEKFADGVTDDIWWHRGRSPSYGGGIALWALGEMVRRPCGLTEDADEPTTRAAVVATLAEFVPDANERERIAPALLTLLGVEEAPAGGRDVLFPAGRFFFERIADFGTTVLVFEDLQWADSALLDFIEHMLDWSRELPILVVTLARPELFDRRPDWGANLRHLTALALAPLADDEVRDLLEGLVPGLPSDALAAIVARAEGMPLYAVEMVRGLLTDGRIERRGDVYEPVGDLSTITVPESLRSPIASRLDGLDPADRALLQDASVVGQVFATDALSAVSGVATDELETRLRDLARRELLDVERDPKSPERGQYKFNVFLIREVAYGTLARRDRRARHGGAAKGTTKRWATMSWPARWRVITSPPARRPIQVPRPMRSRDRRASLSPARPTGRPHSEATTRPLRISTRRWRSRPIRPSARRFSTGRLPRRGWRHVRRCHPLRAPSMPIGNSTTSSRHSRPPGGSAGC